jgi:GNAT superfamily N-acetyltransferase
MARRCLPGATGKFAEAGLIEICEMKRLFVPDRFRGSGTGRRLCEAIIASAKDAGFRLMRLDTGNLLTEAIELYKSIGFHICAPYHQYPEELMAYLVFMEMPLAGPVSRHW